MLAPILLALLGVMLLGTLLIVLGVRGKRLNDHPTCRWCGFDLENIYPANVTCPECGAGLKREKAVRIGQRRKRPVFILSGVLFVLMPLAPIGVVLFASITGTDVNRYKRLGLLLWEVDRVDSKRAALIAGEFFNRLAAANVDIAQEQRILAYTLDRQADPARAWGKEWSDVIDRVRLNGRLMKQDEQRFLSQSVLPKLKARPRVTAGDVFPVGVAHELRAGGDQAMASIWLETATINGEKLNRTWPEPGSENIFGAAAAPNMPLAHIMIMPQAAAWGMPQNNTSVAVFRTKSDLPPGPAVIELEVLVYVEKWTSAVGVMSFGAGKPKPTSPRVRKVKLSVPVEVMPAGVASVERVPASEQLAAELAQKLRPSHFTVNRQLFGSYVHADFSIGDLPVPIVFDVIARTHNHVEGVSKEVNLGTLSSGAADFQGYAGSPWGSDGATRTLWYSGRLPKGKTIDLVLRPRPELAQRTLDLTRVYEGEVIIRGVQVDGGPKPVVTSVQSAIPSDDESDDAETPGADQP
ncbi:MAG TPA: hypothetical protein VD997_00550 [Phycisphaerales bacterium]|nr:hypothetical protein [Phycisphaerales bacterium]